jgi:hypothetical protein
MKLKTKKSSSWKAVQIGGTLESGDFDGFAGLEVLESYDSGFIKQESKSVSFLKIGILGLVHEISYDSRKLEVSWMVRSLTLGRESLPLIVVMMRKNQKNRKLFQRKSPKQRKPRRQKWIHQVSQENSSC